MADIETLATILDHEFEQPDILGHALTHSSIAAGTSHDAGSNERLEFLGDRVLGLIIADLLLTRFPEEAEGDIARRHTALVRKEALARVARSINLGRFIDLSQGEADMGGRENDATLANCCEAVIAALYRDGGLGAAARFIRGHWEAMVEETPDPPKDAKTALQEWAQAQGLALPKYREVNREGPSHAPLFTIAIDVVGLPPVTATGTSKRSAEQRAAQTLLDKVFDAGLT